MIKLAFGFLIFAAAAIVIAIVIACLVGDRRNGKT